MYNYRYKYIHYHVPIDTKRVSNHMSIWYMHLYEINIFLPKSTALIGEMAAFSSLHTVCLMGFSRKVCQMPNSYYFASSNIT